MTTTQQLLRALKKRAGLTSDYQLHKHLAVSKQAISGYMSGDVTLGDEIAVRVAQELDLNAAAVLAAVAADRTTSASARDALRDAVKKLGGIAAGVLLLLSGPGGPTGGAGAHAKGAAQAVDGYYVNRQKKRRKVLGVILASIAAALAPRRLSPA